LFVVVGGGPVCGDYPVFLKPPAKILSDGTYYKKKGGVARRSKYIYTE